MALPALPADGTESDRRAPRLRARVTAADSPRALNELVGLSDSSFTNSRVEPEIARRAARAWSERRQALAERDGRLSVGERHQLAIPPHVRLARRRACSGSSAGAFEVVADQQRSAAGAKVVSRPGSYAARRRDGALEVGEEGHAVPGCQ